MHKTITMRKLISTTTAIVAAMLLFTACNREDSATVDQSKIYLIQNLEYDGATGITTAKAQFRFSNLVGTLLKLSNPATVTADGQPMDLLDALVLYNTTYTGVKDSVTLVYSDLDSNVFTNKLKMIAPVDLPTGIGAISKSTAYDVIFQGAPVGAGESVTVYIKEGNGVDWKAFIQASQGATKVILGTNQLQGLNTGSASIKIERVKLGEPADNPGKGGLTTIKYGSAVQQITITN